MRMKKFERNRTIPNEETGVTNSLTSSSSANRQWDLSASIRSARSLQFFFLMNNSVFSLIGYSDWAVSLI